MPCIIFLILYKNLFKFRVNRKIRINVCVRNFPQNVGLLWLGKRFVLTLLTREIVQ